jgi:DivIVA protein
MEDRSPPPSLNYSLEGLPKGLIGGYDRGATEQLFGRLSVSYKDVLADRARLHLQVRELEATAAQRTDTEHQLTGELEQLKAELEGSRERERSLADRLERAKTYLDEELARVRAELATELERTRAQLVGHEKRELLVTEMLEAAKGSGERIRQEARDEAGTVLKKARKREAQIIRDAEREFKRLEAEKERLTAMAGKLRTDLSTALVTTLEQLKTEDEGKEVALSKSEAAASAASGATGREVSRSRPPKGEGEGVVKRLVPTKRRRAVSGTDVEASPSDSLPESDLNAS